MIILRTIPAESYLRISKPDRKDTASIEYLTKRLISDLKVKFGR